MQGVPWQSAPAEFNRILLLVVVAQVTGPETAEKGCHWLRKVLSYDYHHWSVSLDFHHVPIRKLAGSLFLYISRQIDNGKHQIQCNKTEQWEPRSVLMQTLLFLHKRAEDKKASKDQVQDPETHTGTQQQKAAWGQATTARRRGRPATALTADNRTCQPWRPHKRDVPGDHSV